MNPVISQISAFLKSHKPFDLLSSNELYEIANHISIVHLEKKQTLFQIDDALHDCFYLVHSGKLTLTAVADTEDVLLNKCVSGDIFGLRPFFAKNNYLMTAKAKEDSLIYAIPIAVFKPFLAKNTEILDFLLKSFASNALNPDDNQKDSHSYVSNQQLDSNYAQNVVYEKNPLKIKANTPANQVAVLLKDTSKDCAIVCQNDCPIGIVSHKELSLHIATGNMQIDTAACLIMTSPVVVVNDSISLAEAQLQILNHKSPFLCVTKDGSLQSELKGIISLQDIIHAQSSNPAVLIKEIKTAKNAFDLEKIGKQYLKLTAGMLQQNSVLTHITTLASEIYFAFIKKAIELSISQIGSPPTDFAWFSIGSQGRKEQLLFTDQDSMLVFNPVAQSNYIATKDYFILLAEKTIAILEKIGFEICKNGHTAKSISWCKSTEDWFKQYDLWMKNPSKTHIDFSPIFFDAEFVFGNPEIAQQLEQKIHSNLIKNELFFDFLGNQALDKLPALNFFKKFNLEEDGDYKDLFDIKTKSLLPLIDAARLLTLHHEIKGINNTFFRFKQLAKVDFKNEEIYLNCAEAFLILSKFKATEGFKNDNTGRYINLTDWSKLEKEKLKTATIAIDDLQDLIKSKIKLTKFS
jgi:CBS domain-containing protein